jgi:hypothetical protein
LFIAAGVLLLRAEGPLVAGIGMVLGALGLLSGLVKVIGRQTLLVRIVTVLVSLAFTATGVGAVVAAVACLWQSNWVAAILMLIVGLLCAGFFGFATVHIVREELRGRWAKK